MIEGMGFFVKEQEDCECSELGIYILTMHNNNSKVLFYFSRNEGWKVNNQRLSDPKAL